MTKPYLMIDGQSNTVAITVLLRIWPVPDAAAIDL